MEPDQQSTTVETTTKGQIRVRYNRLTNSQQREDEFVFESSASEWLAECLAKAADDDLPDTEAILPPDHFRIFLGGGHRYDDVNVNVTNLRDPASLYGRPYVLSGMDRDVARNLANQIRAIQR